MGSGKPMKCYFVAKDRARQVEINYVVNLPEPIPIGYVIVIESHGKRVEDIRAEHPGSYSIPPNIGDDVSRYPQFKVVERTWHIVGARHAHAKDDQTQSVPEGELYVVHWVEEVS
jgi:hypothetical protein